MKTSKNDPKSIKQSVLILPLLILILILFATGCGPTPPDSITPPVNTILPTLTPLPPSSTPAPTQTLDLINSGLVYIVVGVFPEGNLPIYREPSISAEITGQIPFSGKSIRTTGNEISADGISWLQVEYQGSAGWVDISHLARQQGDAPEELVAQAHTAIAALKATDYGSLEELVHTDHCLRFSPYPYLRDSDLSFCHGEMAQLPGSGTLYTWGHFDGSGDVIQLTFDNYHQRFIYDQDFFQAEIVGLNEEVSSGNAINNISEIYPDGMIVEYHFPGFDPQYAGMDWRSLRMVFVQDKGGWFLVALVHGEWTI